MRKAVKKPAAPALPDGVLANDLQYPLSSEDHLDYDKGDHGKITFYNVASRGWCIATLHISRGKGGTADRTYGIACKDSAVVTMGKGPHVTQEITVYVRKSRAEALKRYTELYTEGLAKAGTIRDRIGSRRAQGQIERAQGRTSWRWDK